MQNVIKNHSPYCSLKSLLLLPYFILLISGLTVPSDGGHGILSIKSLAFIATTISVGIYLVQSQKMKIQQLKILLFLFCAFTFFLIWSLIGLEYMQTPENGIFDQFKLFWLTVSVVAFSVYLVSVQALSFEAFYKTIIYGNFIFSFAKVSVVILHLLGVIDIWNLVEKFGIRVMGMQIVGNVFRFQASVDIATPFLLFFYLQGPRLGISWGRFFRMLYLPISLFAVFLSFSRFLLLASIVSITVHLLTQKLSIFLRSIAIFIAAGVITMIWIGPETTYTIIERRFLSRDNTSSDNIRQNQIEAILDEHSLYPLMGKGMGGYVERFIRDEKIKHSYEVQWVAFLMQFGVIGLVFILFAIGIIAASILSFPWNMEKIALFTVFLCWIFSGFTNPFLISLTSGILYSLFYLSGKRINGKLS